jgi:hypothetical protein
MWLRAVGLDSDSFRFDFVLQYTIYFKLQETFWNVICGKSVKEGMEKVAAYCHDTESRGTRRVGSGN